MKNERKMKNEINEISCELWMETLKKKGMSEYSPFFTYFVSRE